MNGTSLRQSLFEQRWLLLASGLLFLVATRPFYGLSADDAYISFRYAESWAAGCGPVYSCGEPRVEGYTNFLWVALAAAATGLGLDAVTTMRLAGLLCGLLAVLAAVLLAARLWRGRAAALLPLVAVAASPFFAVNAVVGLETALATLSVLVAALLSLDLPRSRRPWLAGAAWGLSYLVRPEAMAFAALTGAWSLASGLVRREGPKRTLRGTVVYGLGFLAVAGPYFLFRVLYYGDIFPNTYYAKRVPFAVLLPRNLKLLAHDGLFFATLALAALVALLWQRRGRALYLVLLAAVSAAISLSVHNNFWMAGHRLYLTAVALLAVVAGGLADLAPARRGVAPVALAVVVGLLGIGNWAAFAKTRELAETHYARDDHPAARMGRWIRAAARPGDWLAIRDAGMVPYFAGTGVKVLDMHEHSLNDRHITREGWSVAYVMRHRPRFLVLVSYLDRMLPPGAAPCRPFPGAKLAGPDGRPACLAFSHREEALLASGPEFRTAGYRLVMHVPWHRTRHFFLFRRE